MDRNGSFNQGVHREKKGQKTQIDENIDHILSHYIHLHGGIVKMHESDADFVPYLK